MYHDVYNAQAYTRDNAINHASVASQQFFTGTMETMRGFVFVGGGGGVGGCCGRMNATRTSGFARLRLRAQKKLDFVALWPQTERFHRSFAAFGEKIFGWSVPLKPLYLGFGKFFTIAHISGMNLASFQ